ncbi:MAG: RNA polymerase sigma factor [Candidatus Kapaibacterium sp.]|jgi:RNA polymerase sigma-70 factor (ECF subfamily)
MSTDFKQLSDSALCTLVYQGGESSNAAFEALYDRHSPRVYLYCRRVMGEVNVLDDVFQETFVRFYKSLLIERDMSNVPGFLLRIARNLCVAEKKKSYNQTVEFDEASMLGHASSVESDEMLALIDMAITMLPEEFREVWVMKECMGFSYNEIADTLQTTMPTVRTRLYRARNLIREILAPYITDLNT